MLSFADLYFAHFPCCLEGTVFLMIFQLEEPCGMSATELADMSRVVVPVAPSDVVSF